MHGSDSVVSLYGTAEPPVALRQVRIGALSFLYSAESLRRISWHGTELIRAIAWPIRDENWGTYPPEAIEETVEADADRFRAVVTFAVNGGRLGCEVRIDATGRGEVRAEVTLTPVGQPFATNRAGFTVLHPITGVAGSPLEVTHSGGAVEETEFPGRISPDQPVKDIAGLRHGIGAATVDIAFGGEVFEMEDQRNWSDASYKTYCVPLVHPFTYVIAEPATQSIRAVLGGGGAEAGNAAAQVVSAAVTDRLAPQIGLAVEPGWLAGPGGQSAVAACGVSHLALRLPPQPDAGFLRDCADLAGLLDAEVEAEIVLPDGAPVEAGLKAAAGALAGQGLTPRRVLALPDAYLASYQPVGPWPDGPTPSQVVRAARGVFADAAVGGGMMTNFTEFNRCPPDPDLCDYVTHGSTAIVHAGDDMSVIETLEALPQIFASAEAMSGGKPYRLGLVSIAMRSNPYGASVAANPEQVRRTMARVDPRQRGLFAAAWAVGVLAATGGSGVEALCLAAPAGPFGIVHAPQKYPQAGYDDTAAVYPLYHVVREAGRLAGGRRLRFDGLSRPLAAYGAQRDGARRALIANVSDAPQTVDLGREASVAVLDAGTFGAAVADPDWLRAAGRQSLTRLELGPFAVGFVTLND